MSEPGRSLGGGPFVQLAVLCEKVLREQDDVLSLIRIFGRMTTTATGPGAPESMPPSPISVAMVLGFAAGAARGRAAVRVDTYAPSGLRNSQSPSLSVLFESEDRGANVILDVQFVADQEGVYWFEVLVDERPMTRIPLRVVYQRVLTTG